MIRQNTAGVYYCDGRECGYDLSYTPPTDEEHALVSCPDCGAGVLVDDASFRRDATARQALSAAPGEAGE